MHRSLRKQRSQNRFRDPFARSCRQADRIPLLTWVLRLGIPCACLFCHDFVCTLGDWLNNARKDPGWQGPGGPPTS